MNSLIEFLETRAGNYLRTVSEYDEQDVEFHYVRRDLDAEAIEDGARELHDELLMASKQHDLVTESAGDRYASMHLHEQCIFITVPVESDAGIVVTLEPEAGSQLTTFVKQCANYVEREWPYALG